MKALKGVLLAAGLIMMAGGTAYANLVVLGAPTVSPDGSNFLWSYTLATDASQVINTGANASFFTLYDLNAMIPGSEAYSSLVGTLSGTATSALLGVTPVGVVPTDSPAIPNITVSFLGTAPSSTDIGVLSFLDTEPASSTVQGQFAAQGTNALNGSRAFNSSFVAAPAPEPGSLVLLGSGILGMVGMGLRRFRKG